MRFFPNVEEERTGVLKARLKGWKSSGLIDPAQERIIAERRTRWVHSALISRLIYFVLTLVCVAAIYGLAGLAGRPEDLVTAVVCLATAEILILKWGLFRAGPDEALYIAGLFLLIHALPGPPRDEGILLFSAALLLAGSRLRNGLFLTASIVAAVFYVATKTESGEVGGLLSLAVGFAGIALLNREMEHPIWDEFFSWIIVVMPALAYVLVKSDAPGSTMYVIVIASIVSAILIATGLAIRNHAPLISGLIVAGIAGYETGQRIALPMEIRLMLGGATLGVLVLVVHRFLAGRMSGITADQLLESHAIRMLEPAAAAVLAGSQTRDTAASDSRTGGGGSYGGGGASGEF